MKEVDNSLYESCIDKTLDFLIQTRGDEINAWLNKNKDKVENFIVLDDNSNHDLEQFGDRFVQTSMRSGLTKEIADKCIELLR